MPKATSKDQLLADIMKERTALEQLLESLTVEQMSRPGVHGEWSIKDVLGHLVEWEQMVLGWYAAGKRGEKPIVPSEDYNWGQLPLLNQKIYEKYCDRPLDEVLILFQESYRQILEAVQAIPEDELFQRALYPWMNQNALAAYFASATSSHYRWARTGIRKGLKG